jgi:type I restriction enzyme, S subunit
MTQVIPKWFKQTDIGVIPEEWEVVELWEILQNKWYIRWPFWSALKRWEMIDSWIPVYEQQNAIYNHRNFRYYIDNEKFNILKRFQVRTNDIILSCSWTVWKVSIISSSDEKWIISQALLILRLDINKINLIYFYYFITSNIWYHAITSRSLWSVQINIAKKAIVEWLTFSLPPLSQQKAIAEILSSIDDKIELLEKQNKTLENIGQAIFKSWFVDFEGFENDLVESEMGMIPRGWDIGKLKDVSIIQNGYAFKSWDYVNEWNIIIRTKNFSDSWYVEMKDLVYLNDTKANEYKKFRFELFDFLLVMVWASIWKNVIVTQINLPSLQNQNMWNFKPLNEEERFYNIFVIKQLIKQNIWAVSWSARDFFRKDQFYNFDIVIPSKDIVIKFDTIIRPNYEKISLNLLEIQTLSNLRDSLLPRLMNGKVRV